MVHDLGRDVPADSFLAKAEETKADVFGMSALLTTTMEPDQIGAHAYAEDANDGVKTFHDLIRWSQALGRRWRVCCPA